MSEQPASGEDESNVSRMAQPSDGSSTLDSSISATLVFDDGTTTATGTPTCEEWSMTLLQTVDFNDNNQPSVVEQGHHSIDSLYANELQDIAIRANRHQAFLRINRRMV